MSGRRRSTTSLGLRSHGRSRSLCVSPHQYRGPTIRRQRAWRTLVALRANIPMYQMGFALEGEGRPKGCSSCVTVRAIRGSADDSPDNVSQIEIALAKEPCELGAVATPTSRKQRVENTTGTLHCTWRGGAHLRRLRCGSFCGGAVVSEKSARAIVPTAMALWRVAPLHSRKGNVITPLKRLH